MLFTFLIFYSQILFAEPLSLPKEKLDLLRTPQLEELVKACEEVKGKNLSSWLLGEIKKAGFENLTIETTQIPGWQSQNLEFKLGEKDIEGTWIQGSYGTYGDYKDQNIKNANDKSGKVLTGQIVDVGFATESVIKNLGALEGRFWLVERSKLIPNPVAIAVTAAKKKALGVIIYDQQDSVGENIWGDQVPVTIPVLVVKYKTAKKIILKIKQNEALMTLSIETHFPKIKTHEHILVKEENLPLPFVLSANTSNCRETSSLLQIMDWLKKSEISHRWSYFVFLNEREDIRRAHPEWAKTLTKEFPLENVSPDEIQDFAVNWLMIDHSPERIIILKDILERGTKIMSSLRGVVDDDRLRKFSDLLHRVDGVPKTDSLGYQLNQLFLDETVNQISKGATDFRTLQSLYQHAQRGHWDLAKLSCKSLDGFNYVENLASDSFAEIQKVKQNIIDPQIWGLLAGGIENLDKLLDLLEGEQDALEKRLNDNFFKLESSLDKLVGLNVSARADTKGAP